MLKIKFRTKLIAIFVIAIIIQGIVIGYFSHYYAKEIVMKNKQRDMSDMINLVDININIRVRNITELIDSAAKSHTVRNLFSNGKTEEEIYVMEYFQNLDSSFGAVNTVIIMDNSKIVFSQNRNNELSNAYNAYQEAVSHLEKTNWIGASDSIISRLDEENDNSKVITVSRAILGEDLTDILGVLIVELDPVTFSSLMFNNHNTFQNQYTYIIDNKRDIIGSNKNVNEDWIDVIADKFDNGIRKFEMEWEGETYYVCGQYNGITGWKTFSVLLADYIFPQADVLRNFIILSVVFCTICVSVIIMAISYTMTQPVKKLSAAMERVQEGDFSIQLNTGRKDEMGMLMGSFDFMINKINTLIREVYEEKIAQKNAELEALEARINPHFLYNTLDSINWMLIEKDEYEISEVIVSLGDLLKYCVDKNNSVVQLEQEIDYIISYLLIQKTRLEERLSCRITIPEHLRTFSVPKLILQPLVENAIIHGIEPVKKGGTLTITAYESESLLHIEVEDDGSGMEEKFLEELTINLSHEGSDFNSIGVYNVDKRLRLHYGEVYGLKIFSSPGHGTKIMLNIPKEKREVEQ